MFATGYCELTVKFSEAAGIAFDPEEGKTQQHFAEEVDINTIVERFGLTGKMPDFIDLPTTSDFVDAMDFHSAMNEVKRAEAAFLTIPPDVRRRFDHDPGKLLAFLEDDRNREEAVKLGLVKEAAKPVRDVVAAVDELAAKMTSVPKPAV